MSPRDEPESDDAQRAFGGEPPTSGADAFGSASVTFGPPVPPGPPPSSDPPPPPGGFHPPAGPSSGPAPTSTWQPATPGNQQPVSTWPSQQPSLPSADGAVASMVLGVLSWILCPIILSIPALILANQARREIAANPGRLGGRDTAGAGWWLGLTSLAVYGGMLLIFVIVALAGA